MAINLQVGLWPDELARVQAQCDRRGIDIAAYIGHAVYARLIDDEAADRAGELAAKVLAELDAEDSETIPQAKK